MTATILPMADPLDAVADADGEEVPDIFIAPRAEAELALVLGPMAAARPGERFEAVLEGVGTVALTPGGGAR